MSPSDILANPLLVAAISAAVGVLLTVVATKVLAKTAILRYSTRTDRTGTAADDLVFGNVRVSWRDNPVRNLYMTLVEIENTSNRDFENVGFSSPW